MSLVQWMDKKFYPHHNKNWDDQLLREKILNRLQSHFICLDYGAGRGLVEAMHFKGMAKLIAGVDPDPAVLENPNLDEAKCLDLERFKIPYPDNHFDLVFSDNVLEHLLEPLVVFREIHRVLKPEGFFIAKTPNKWHYVAILARLTPEWFHRFYNKIRGRNAEDTFPTVYRCNSEKEIKRIGSEAGFNIKELEMVEGRPEYLRINPILYTLGLIYERCVNSATWLANVRCVIYLEMKK